MTRFETPGNRSTDLQRHSRSTTSQSSNKLAEEKVPDAYFDRTKYSKGILPIDTYKTDVNEIVKPEYNYDWESLRTLLITTNGLRNSTLSLSIGKQFSLCQMPLMESNHLVDPCPLKDFPKDRSNKLFQGINILKTIILFFGTCLIIWLYQCC